MKSIQFLFLNNFYHFSNVYKLVKFFSFPSSNSCILQISYVIATVVNGLFFFYFSTFYRIFCKDFILVTNLFIK